MPIKLSALEAAAISQLPLNLLPQMSQILILRKPNPFQIVVGVRGEITVLALLLLLGLLVMILRILMMLMVGFASYPAGTQFVPVAQVIQHRLTPVQRWT